MPRGGKRLRAGRPKDAKNKRNTEREHRKLQIVAMKRGEETPGLGKDVLEYFMETALRYAKAYEPTDADLSYDPNPEVQEMRDWKRNQFKMWANLAAAWASDLAPYQSPTFRAISISPMQDDRPKGPIVMHTIEQIREQLILRGVPPTSSPALSSGRRQ
jgi:hypothetical protein